MFINTCIYYCGRRHKWFILIDTYLLLRYYKMASDLKIVNELSQWNIFRYCWPAILYFVYALSRICVNVYLHAKISYWLVFIKFVGVVLWTYALNWLCRKGYGTIAWAMVLLPFAIMFTVM